MRNVFQLAATGKRPRNIRGRRLFVVLCFIFHSSSLILLHAAFDDPGLGARLRGLGNSVTALEDMNGAFLNPAVSGSARKFDSGAHFEAGTRSSLGPLDFYSYSVNAALPGMVYGKFGTMSVIGRYKTMDDPGLAEKTLGFGWGTWQLRQSPYGTFDLGANVKFMQLDAESTSDSKMGLGLDLGALWRVNSRRSFGFSFLNVNSPSFKEGVLNDKAPAAIRLGAAERGEDYTLTMDVARRSAAASYRRSYSFNCGIEYVWRTYRSGIFTSRTGLSLAEKASLFSLGIGHRHLASEISYAILFPLSGTIKPGHALSLNIRFGDKDLESEYETLMKREIKYRKDLVTALDESSRREGILREDLNGLKDEIAALNASLNSAREQKAEAAQAREKLEAVVVRQRRAETELKSLEEKRRRDRLTQLELEFSRDWRAYLKMKAGGAPKEVLKGSLQRLLGQYQDAGIDISPATSALQQLVGQ